MLGTELWSAIASGEVSLRDLGGVDAATISRIRTLGITAFTCGRYEQAAKIFAGLEALDPKDPQHSLHLGHALASLGNKLEAREAITRFIDAASEVARVEQVRALLFRSSLELGMGNTTEASSDVALAKKRAGDDAESAELLAKVGVP